MRFFYNVSNNVHSLADGEGELHETIADAMAAADDLAHALFRDSPNWHDFKISVIDALGKMISCMPIDPAECFRFATLH